MKNYLHNSLRALFLSLAVLLSLPMLAEEVEIDGINYELVAKIKEATVIKKSNGEYSGKVVIPESVEHQGTTYSVTSIGVEAFYMCSGLTSVSIPNSVTSIGEYAFAFCSGLTSVTIPNSVTSIGEGAFCGCSGLTSVTIGNSVESIGSSAFYGCSGLTSVTIPNSVESIGEFAFYGCSGLTEMKVDANNSKYDSREGCNAIIETSSNTLISGCQTTVIPNSVTSIGDHAFRGCSGLTSVTIPNSVTSIGSSAFSSCDDLTTIKVDENNPIYDSRDNCNAIIETASNTLMQGCKTTTIPNNVTSIGGSAFSGCSGLTSVTIPNSVTSIGEWAFYKCSGLTSVTIGSGVTSIGGSAFSGCSGLTSVSIPNSVTSIGKEAFRGCYALTSVTIGDSVTSIGGSAFRECGLQNVYCYAENVPSTSSNAFISSNYKNATLHVPAASIENYKAKTPWSSFGRIMGLSGGEPEVPEVEKCATLVVSYADGKLSMACETEGAVFVTKIVSDDISTFYDAEIELSATYNIEVYASKANFENSDTISVALVWVENGDVSEETGVISVEAAPVLIQGNGGVLNISGVAKDTEIVVYTVSGTEVARATATETTTTINTGLQSGTIVIVKFGNKSVKVRI